MMENQYFIIYYSLLRKELVRIFRIWPQTLLPSIITIILYFLIFGNIIGNKIGNMCNFEYKYFITPGLVIMAVINNSYANVVSSFYGAKFNRSIEELLVSCANNHLIILGYISGGVVRGFLLGIIVSLVATIFGGVSFLHFNIFLIALSFLLCSILFSLAGFLTGLLSQKFDDTTIISSFILTPLMYLGGIFYSIDTLPTFWQNIIQYNPLFYIIEFMRFAFIRYSFINPLISMMTIISFIILLYTITWHLMKKESFLKP